MVLYTQTEIHFYVKEIRTIKITTWQSQLNVWYAMTAVKRQHMK
jgi:hypothetical protein